MKTMAEVYWDRGRRALNQDSVSLQEVRICGKKVLFTLVCDGIGGLQEGETASGAVCERMTQWFYEEGIVLLRKHKPRKKIQKAGLRALYACHEELKTYGEKKSLKLGTTVTMLLLWKKKYILWHSGDTRAYQVQAGCWFHSSAGRLRQLTCDHTVDNHTLIRCVGSMPWKEPDTRTGVLRGSCTLLLCSDGFRNRVREEQLKEAMHPLYLQSGEQLRMRLRELAEYVKRQGERDNLSAVAVRVE